MADWEDTSSYSYRDRLDDKKPTCWSLSLVLEADHLKNGRKEVVVQVHRRPQYDGWWVSCVAVLLGPELLNADTPEEAQVEGLELVHKTMALMTSAVAKELINV